MSAARRGGWPAVSVVLPVLNEERHLRAAVRSVLDQDYDGEIQVVLALGPSRDRTDAVAAELASDDRVRLVRNPTGRTPTGLNLAIAASSHDIVARVDGHAELPPGYLRTAVELIERTGADNVGGLMSALGVTDLEQAVARAMTSRLGVGNAPFHVGGTEGPVDTVYLGVFRRSALARVGGYDEAFTRAQDWEMNYRIRSTGGQVWFSPELSVSYRPRGSWRALARQYFRTGQGRRQVVHEHPDSVTLRYLAPPVAVVGVAAGLVVGALGPRWALLLPAGYVGLVAVGSFPTGRDLPPRARAVLPLVLATMHLAWGSGFLAARRRSGV
jgi:cellulose synthase/poly-beta-1,6-N-acetylglucosamine synthase-like glycosyltransferase